MNCQSKLYAYCKKTMKKSSVAHIWYKGKYLLVCKNCFWLIKQLNKDMGKPVGRPKKNENNI